jgi:hypothetical protein
MSRRPDEMSSRQADGNTATVPEIVLCEVAVLAEQAFYANATALMKPTSCCLARQTRLFTAASLKSAARRTWRL